MKRTWQNALQNGCSAAFVNSLLQLHFCSVARLRWLQVDSERRLIVVSSSSATVLRTNASASPWTTEAAIRSKQKGVHAFQKCSLRIERFCWCCCLYFAPDTYTPPYPIINLSQRLSSTSQVVGSKWMGQRQNGRLRCCCCCSDMAERRRWVIVTRRVGSLISVDIIRSQSPTEDIWQAIPNPDAKGISGIDP